MRISIETQAIVKNRSGIGWYAYNLINEMLKIAKNDEIIGSVFDFLGRNNSKEKLEEVGFSEIEVSKWIPYRVYKLLWDIIPFSYDNFFSKNDIYHFFNYTVPPRVKGNIITNVYDMVYKLYPETMNITNSYILNREMDKTIKRADRIVTISESAKRDIIEHLDIPEEKIRIIYPGINHGLYSNIDSIDSETKRQIKGKYNLPDKYILYLGTIEPRKNIAKIFEAYSQLNKDIKKEHKLVIAGGKGWKCDDILNIPKKLGFSEDIIFTGYVNEEDKPIIYSMAEVFIFPSLYEGFGMPVLEAMAAGIPVITSNCSSLPEAGGDAAIYVNPKDSSSITQNIEKIILEDDFKKEKINLGQQHIKNFNWKKSAEKMMNIYNEFKE